MVWKLSEGVESLVNESGRNGKSDDGNATMGMEVDGSDGGDAGTAAMMMKM